MNNPTSTLAQEQLAELILKSVKNSKNDKVYTWFLQECKDSSGYEIISMFYFLVTKTNLEVNIR